VLPKCVSGSAPCVSSSPPPLPMLRLLSFLAAAALALHALQRVPSVHGAYELVVSSYLTSDCSGNAQANGFVANGVRRGEPTGCDGWEAAGQGGFNLTCSATEEAATLSVWFTADPFAAPAEEDYCARAPNATGTVSLKSCQQLGDSPFRVVVDCLYSSSSNASSSSSSTGGSAQSSGDASTGGSQSSSGPNNQAGSLALAASGAALMAALSIIATTAAGQ